MPAPGALCLVLRRAGRCGAVVLWSFPFRNVLISQAGIMEHTLGNFAEAVSHYDNVYKPEIKIPNLESKFRTKEAELASSSSRVAAWCGVCPVSLPSIGQLHVCQPACQPVCQPVCRPDCCCHHPSVAGTTEKWPARFGPTLIPLSRT